jgi:hypothetical protein
LHKGIRDLSNLKEGQTSNGAGTPIPPSSSSRAKKQ